MKRMMLAVALVAFAAASALGFDKSPAGTATTIAPPPHASEFRLPNAGIGLGPVVSVQAPPQISSWSGSAYYDVAAKRFSGVVFNRIGELTLKGKGSGIEVNGFVGAQNSKGTPATIGLAALWHRDLFDQVSVVFGLGGSLTGGKIGGGPIAGVAVRF